MSYITLVIAVFGIFLFRDRRGEVSRQRHISLQRCLGPSKERIFTGSLQLFVFAYFRSFDCSAIRFSVGASLIVDIVIKQSFWVVTGAGVIPWDYLATFARAMAALMLAGALPVMRMIRNTRHCVIEGCANYVSTQWLKN